MMFINSHILPLVREHVKSRGNFVMKASHPFGYLKGTPNNDKKHVGSLGICSDISYELLKYISKILV